MAVEGQKHLKGLLACVDEDTEAFNRIMAALGMPKGSEEEKKARAAALEEATLYAAEVPLDTARRAIALFPLLEKVASQGNPASASDAGVGALAACAAVRGAALNVRINAAGLKDKQMAFNLIDEANTLADKAVKLEKEILDIVNANIDK